jgi:hypothetical protein
MESPSFALMWLSEKADCSSQFHKMLGPRGGQQQHTVEGQWQYWQQAVLGALQPLLACMRSLGMAPPAAAAATAEEVDEGPVAPPPADAGLVTNAQAGGSAATDQGCSSSSSSNSTGNASNAGGNSISANQQVKWGYLLRLQQASPRWAAAVAAFDVKWPGCKALAEGDLPASAAAAAQLVELYDDAVGLCRTLAAAAPITVACNNPSCESLAGVSKAAASCKACAGCSCRYCSVACQKADWKRHKGACKRMAAAGQTCV